MLNNVFDKISGFFEKYFLDGLVNDSAYNWIDTTVYSVIFIAAVWLLYEKVFKSKINVNRNFVLALIGWIVFGSSMRAAEDAEIFKTAFLVTPLFYFTVFLVAFPMLLLSLYFDKKIPYWKTWGSAGYLLGMLVLLLLPLKNISGFLIVLAIWLFWIILFLAFSRVYPKFFTTWNLAALSAHMFDASSTFAALTFFSNFSEKHVLGRTLIDYIESNNVLLINGSASWVMFALKLVVVPLVLYAIDKYGETENEKNFLKMIILMLGIAIGLRNTLEIVMFT